MTDAAVKRLALVLAKQAEIEAMKAFNAQRLQEGLSPGYTEHSFYAAAEDLRVLAAKHESEF